MATPFAQFCNEIAQIRKEAKERRCLISEQNILQFNSIEEVRKYMESTSFINWENMVFNG